MAPAIINCAPKCTELEPNECVAICFLTHICAFLDKLVCAFRHWSRHTGGGVAFHCGLVLLVHVVPVFNNAYCVAIVFELK